MGLTKIKFLIAATVVLGVFLGLMLEGVYWGRVAWGVRVGRVEVGGMKTEEARAKILNQLRVSQIEVVWGTTKTVIPANRIGLLYEPDRSWQKAVSLGHDKGILVNWSTRGRALRWGMVVDPVFTLDENRLAGEIASIASYINIPAVEPEIQIETFGKTKRVNVSLGENGQEVDEQKLISRVRAVVAAGDNEEIEIPIVRITPKLSDDEAKTVLTRAEKIVDRMVEVKFDELALKWDIGDEELTKWIDAGGGWKRPLIELWGQQLAQNVDRPAQNAQLHFVRPGRVEEFKPGRDGYRVDQLGLTANIEAALTRLLSGSPKEVVDLPVERTAPEVKTGDANNLGIKELIGRGESWFVGSITNRIYNLQKAAAEINGVLVAPGETFSFNQTVGDISSATGYRQAYIIKEGRTILGDGGGVCQVSSTLFRAVLSAGLPIEARTAHAFRVSYYEVKYQPGFDATVFQPEPDFKFRNDTQGHILIQTVYDEKTKYLAFEIYGTSDGRKVEISKARIWDVVAPPPDLYQDDPTLAVGVVREVEHKAWGAKVAFDWKVTRGEEMLQERTFYSNYRPWQAVFLRGTKTN
ncbi:hypothetical protein A2634_01825 [Candidatus Amesbacteria bacterium RIFCSPHIGHO2_01_FULL_48_32]|uniref:YoaR-like putative peptidoglycan binding domain-containing protein n=1 Tax=Candidatus Amesbacteria bacterium RIFCSPLOWO2_01_FULL_48_25 TaxID=1797259 RepID=A0A1F4ZAW9_9BACT|nr:MAG: hypothetical protein A2634_01825 [Candidatus Amesbacteria bacterium RIFCSPHIGHO2_01_FULL_48_32]OGD03398.1 MAG: hypothetical protein A2989_01025 [Candidatus Amesbacteria bacterium RIFCSPLOWO2_01_FULL_48_25]HJZ05015.1 VanW family protein [Patescibacteria group bacterium]